jgi:hypothetical protein
MPKQSASVGPKVPYLPKQHIEDEATLLLGEYGRVHGVVTAPPIPIDDIIEVHLRLTVEFKEMEKLFTVGDVHGALWVNRKLVGVDVSLDPTKHPAKQGRYHFTLAHEAGHWRLHRHLYLRPADQRGFFPDGEEKPDVVCRSSEKKKPIEWQADQFAANLLMPREILKRAWHEWHGSMAAIYLTDLRAESSDEAADEMLSENAARPLACQFQVSAEAMRIRLEELRLLLRKKEASLFE